MYHCKNLYYIMCILSPINNVFFLCSGFNFSVHDMKEHPILTYHRMIEAFNFVAAKETYLTDPDFDNQVNQVRCLLMLTNYGYFLSVAVKNLAHSIPTYYDPINCFSEIHSVTHCGPIFTLVQQEYLHIADLFLL